MVERDAIEGDQRYEGSIVYVEETQTTYQLRGGSTNDFWVTLVSAAGLIAHGDLEDIGTNSHTAIDSHIADSTIHFDMASISITESQISDFGSYAVSGHDHAATYLGITATAVAANGLGTIGATVVVSGSAPPVAGNVLVATSATAAAWQPPATGGGTGDIIQTGSPADTHIGYFTADKNLSGDSGLTWITASARLNVIGTSPVIRLQDSNSTDVTMTPALEFYSSSALVGSIAYASGNMSLFNAAGSIILDTDGVTSVAISGDGDISMGGYLLGYAGTPTDGQLFVWVTANNRAEFITAPTGIVPTGTPVAEQIVVFDSATSAVGAVGFTWSGSIFTAGDFILNNSNDQLFIGDGTLASPGIEINGSIAANPFINLQQNSVTKAVLRYSNSSTRLELSSAEDNITLRPGNVDTLTLTQAALTLTGNIVLSGTVDGRDVDADGTAQDSHIADAAIHSDWTAGTVAGFHSLGIDDNATGERLDLSDTAMVLGIAGNSAYAITRVDATGRLDISGGTGTTNGGNIQLLGGSHATVAGDVRLRSGSNIFLEWDESAGTFVISTGTGAKTTFLTIDTSNATFTGNIALTPATTVDPTINLTPDGTTENPSIKWNTSTINRADLIMVQSNQQFKFRVRTDDGVYLRQQMVFNSGGDVIFQTGGVNATSDAVEALRIKADLSSDFAGQINAPASTTAIPSMRLPHGAAPTTPTDGDMWTTTAGLYVRINGATVGPLS